MIYLGLGILFLIYDIWNQLQKDDIYNERIEDLEVRYDELLEDRKVFRNSTIFLLQENSMLKERLAKAKIDTAPLSCYTQLFSEMEDEGSITENEDGIIE